MQRGAAAEFLVGQVADGDDEVAAVVDVGEVAGPQAGQWQVVAVGGGDCAGVDRSGPPRPPATIGDLAAAIWLIGESWLPFPEVTGDPQDPAQVARGADLVAAVLQPYLGESGTAQEEP